MICSKEYSITIATGLEFAWGTAILNPGAGSALFVPENSSSNSAICALSLPGLAIEGNDAQNFGTLTMTTTSVVPCNMHINLASTGTAPITNWVWTLVVTDLTTIFDLLSESSGSLGNSGSFDIAFNIPNTAGIPRQFGWTIFLQLFTDAPEAASLSVQGIATVL